jgi:hypothetical protein
MTRAANLAEAAGSGFAFRNRIINGDMRIDQRNAGAAVTPGSGISYTLDRWAFQSNLASKFTIQQNAGSVTPPAGFNNYLGATVASAATLAVGDYCFLWQALEGFNCVDLAWGTSSAKAITLSFWVYSSLTGTFGGSIQNYASTRSYPFSYTVGSANTWTQITITIPGDTGSDWLTVNKTNGGALVVNFGLGLGSTFSGTAGAWITSNKISVTGAVNVISNSGATFYITGVQLEKGSVATPFENRIYSDELAMCQRYYQKSFSIGTAPANGYAASSSGMPRYTGWVRGDGTFITSIIQFVVPMRTQPTINTYYPSGGSAGQGYGGIGNSADALIAISGVDSSQQSEKGWAFYITGKTGGNVGQVGVQWDTSGAEL